eukprot:349899-Chlamydomonas_euryale.AAC.2
MNIWLSCGPAASPYSIAGWWRSPHHEVALKACDPDFQLELDLWAALVRARACAVCVRGVRLA